MRVSLGKGSGKGLVPAVGISRVGTAELVVVESIDIDRSRLGRADEVRCELGPPGDTIGAAVADEGLRVGLAEEGFDVSYGGAEVGSRIRVGSGRDNLVSDVDGEEVGVGKDIG